jgi:hypothetical protein
MSFWYFARKLTVTPTSGRVNGGRAPDQALAKPGRKPQMAWSGLLMTWPPG